MNPQHTQGFQIEAQCGACGHVDTFSKTMAEPTNGDRRVLLPAGDLLGSCSNCGAEVRTATPIHILLAEGENELVKIEVPASAKCSNTKCPNNSIELGGSSFIEVPRDSSRFAIISNDEHNLICPLCRSKILFDKVIAVVRLGKLEASYSYGDYEGAWRFRFTKCIVDSQVYGSNNEHMNSRVFFDAERIDELGTKPPLKLECTIRQPAGESYSYETSPIEVDTPDELKRKVNHAEFKEAVEIYFKSLVSKDSLVVDMIGRDRVGKNPTIRIYDSTFIDEAYAVVHSNISQGHGGW